LTRLTWCAAMDESAKPDFLEAWVRSNPSTQSGRCQAESSSALFGSFVFGSPAFPLSDIPFQTIFDRVGDGSYLAKPARTFRFEEIQDAHRLIDSNQANGKIVVTLN
jgi:hypothetical protein